MVVETGRDILLLTDQPLSLDELYRAVESEETGAIVTFSGVVRRTEKGRAIEALDYDHYAAMAEKEIRRLMEEAHRRWPIQRIALAHRWGRVNVGDPSVIVAVGAAHRAEAFEACRFLIDELKRSVPIWKSVGGDNGTTQP